MEREGLAERLAVLWSRVRALFSRERLDAEFAEEIASHLDLLAAEHVRRGLPPDDARRAARLEFGGSMQLTEARREQRSLPFIETTAQDLRYACRTLAKNPGFSAVVVLTLAAGIGAATSMFTVVRAVLLRPLPFAQPERLVEITETNPLKNWTHTVAAPANLLDWRARNDVFGDIAGYLGVDDRGASGLKRFVEINGEPEPLAGVATTGNLFDLLGVRPILGHTFTWEETFDSQGNALLLAYGTWQRLFGGDAHVVGRTISLSGRTKTIVGVMPRDFFFPNPTAQFWAPIGVPAADLQKARRPHYLSVIARLRDGVTVAQARDRMTRIASDLEREYPDTNTKMGVRIEPLHQIMAADARTSVLMLFGAVTVLFLIVCANIASLQLGRASSRRHEIAVRRALGAGRPRLVRQLLTENLLLSIVGSSIGIAIAFVAPSMIVRAAPSALPLFAAPRIDLPVLLFAAVLSIAAPIVFGLAPALSSSRSEQLAQRVDSGSRQTSTARDVLVAFEVMLSVVLLVASMLLVRSLVRLQRVDPGFRPQQAVAFNVTLPSLRFPKDTDRLHAFEEVERRLRALPGVDAVGETSTLVLRGYTWSGDATVEGHGGDDYERELRHKSVTPDYFRAAGIRLVAGRMLTGHDDANSNVTLVNATLARTYFHGVDPIGKRLKFGRPKDSDPWTTVIGVVADAKQDGMDKPVRPEVYVPLAANLQNPVTFVVRSSIDPEPTIAAARQTVRAVGRDFLVSDVTTLQDLVNDSIGDERFRTSLLTAFAGIALFLAALGIYGILAYFVTQRSRELGIRLALGAKPQAVFALVVRQGMQPVAIGAIAGVVAALALTGTIQSLLFGVTPLDPATYGSTIGILTLSAFVACALPAARATRVDPLVALRDE
jgi:putative ABC transport system permease protein